MEDELVMRRAELVNLTRHDADPKVRHRAHALVDLVASGSGRVTAERVSVSGKSLGRWRARFLAEGRAGLCDRPRAGRPPALPAEARAALATALATMPMTYGYPVTTWTMADLTDLLARRNWVVSTGTVNRTVHQLGYVHRRPRHDPHHRQDAEAVASAQQVLATLQKKGLIAPAESASSISTSASFTPIPTWQKSGAGGANPAGFPRREPTGA